MSEGPPAASFPAATVPPSTHAAPSPHGHESVAAPLRAVRATLPAAFDDWRRQRGRPRARTLRRITQTTELLLRIETEVLLPALVPPHETAARAEADALQQEVELLRDVIGTVMHGPPARREASVTVLEGLGTDHGQRLDDWLRTRAVAPPGDRGEAWSMLAQQVHERLRPWVALDDAGQPEAVGADDAR